VSDVVKWALLVAGALIVIAAIVIPLSGAIDLSALSTALGNLTTQLSSYLYFGRCLLNNFLLPAARPLASVVIVFEFTKWFVLLGVRIVSAIYHWIFKG
jgi:hypothetical protein